jgi:hypothetical protein
MLLSALMRALLLLALLSSPAFAQAPDAGTADPNEYARVTARAFFSALIQGDASEVVHHIALPFQLDATRLTEPDQTFQAFAKALREKRTDLLTLYGIELLTPAEMEKRHGKPPARLAQLPWKSSHTLIAIGNLSGHAGVALLHEVVPNHWAVIAYTD